MTSISMKLGREMLVCVTENYLGQYRKKVIIPRESLRLFGTRCAGRNPSRTTYRVNCIDQSRVSEDHNLRRVEVHDGHEDTRRGEMGVEETRKKAENAKLKIGLPVRRLPSGFLTEVMSFALDERAFVSVPHPAHVLTPARSVRSERDGIQDINADRCYSFILDIRTRFRNRFYPPPEGVSGITSRNLYPVLRPIPAQ